MKVLIAVDGSEHSANAIFLACRVLKPHHRVATLYVTPKGKNPGTGQVIAQYAADVLEQFSQVPKENILPLAIESDNPKKGILDQCRTMGIDLLVTGSRGLSRLKRLTVGSVSYALANNDLKLPVLVVHAPPAAQHADRPLRVLSLVDGSPASMRAARLLGALVGPTSSVDLFTAQTPPQRFVVIAAGVGGATVVENPRHEEQLVQYRASTQELLKSAKHELVAAAEANRPADPEIKGVLSQSFDHGRSVLDHLEGHAPYDIIAVGSRGLGTVSRALLGSVSNAILHEAKNSAVLVVH
eukprot:TRINITY_DN48679_c0_g1_i1.p1 TRINITY_DN48679_c0_g1~~TRINITY_DN48679_c0_g1_i1.p1  ORF type:complete len:322 (+),score=45.35 TRINITY_DN48679_c0_g1_i1:74-967(+)